MIRKKLETLLSTILIWVIALILAFGVISMTRYAWRNDCLTSMQVLKFYNKALSWDEEKLCPEPKKKKK